MDIFYNNFCVDILFISLKYLQVTLKWTVPENWQDKPRDSIKLKSNEIVQLHNSPHQGHWNYNHDHQIHQDGNLCYNQVDKQGEEYRMAYLYPPVHLHSNVANSEENDHLHDIFNHDEKGWWSRRELRKKAILF